MGVTLRLSSEWFQNCHIGLGPSPNSPAHVDYWLSDLSHCQAGWTAWHLNEDKEKELGIYFYWGLSVKNNQIGHFACVSLNVLSFSKFPFVKQNLSSSHTSFNVNCIYRGCSSQEWGILTVGNVKFPQFYFRIRNPWLSPNFNNSSCKFQSHGCIHLFTQCNIS